MAEKVAAHLEVYGKVQGVFFRDTIRRVADKYSISGSAVNRKDGSVEVFLEGPRGAVDRVIDAARAGSSASTVERVEVEWQDPTGVSGFAID